MCVLVSSYVNRYYTLTKKIGANLFGGWLNVSFNVKQPIQKERINMKQFIINITGVVIPENEWDNTSIYRVDNSTGEWCELEFDKTDIVKVENEND